MAQKQLVQNLMEDTYLKPVSDDEIDIVFEEHGFDNKNDQNSTTFFKTCADEVLETLDYLLFECRLEEALRIFETEDGNPSGSLIVRDGGTILYTSVSLLSFSLCL